MLEEKREKRKVSMWRVILMSKGLQTPTVDVSWYVLCIEPAPEAVVLEVQLFSFSLFLIYVSCYTQYLAQVCLFRSSSLKVK